MAGVDQEALPRLDQLLAHRYRSLLGEIRDELGHSDNSGHQAAAGLVSELADRSAADLLAELCQPAVDRHLAELRHILYARRRIRQGTYGICDACGAPMQIAWLEAHLTAQRCAECNGEPGPRR